MAEKILNTRILMKVDTLEAWNSSSLKLKKGELAFATVAASAGTGLTEPVVMVKIGTEEEKTFSELPWAFHAKASDVLSACKSEAALKTFVNGVIADAGIASSDAMEALAGRVTTAEGKITTLEGEMDAVEKKASDNETAIGVLNGDASTAGSVAKSIADAIAALKLGDTYAAKVHTHEIADVNGLSDALAGKETAGEAAKVQTALDTYKTANDKAVQKNATDIAGEITRAKAAEEANANAIATIKDGTTIDSFADVEAALAGKQAVGDYATKTEAQGYANAKDTAIAEAKKAGTDAAEALEAYKTSNDKAVAAVKATADAAAVKADVDTALAGKVDKVENKSLIADSEITRLAGMSDGANKVEKSETNGNIKIDGVEAVVYTHPTAHAISEITGLQTALDGKQAVGDYATKTEAQGYADAKDAAIEAAQAAADKAQGEVDDLETYVGTFTHDTAKSVVEYIDAKTSGIATDASLTALTNRVTTAEGDIDKLEAAVEAINNTESGILAQAKTYADGKDASIAAAKKAGDDAQADVDALAGKVGEVPADKTVVQMIADAQTAATYNDTQVKADIKANADAIDAIEADYLKKTDKDGLQEQITANANAITLLTNGVSAEEVDGVNDLIQYVKDHGTEVTTMQGDIADNAKAIADEKTRAEGIEGGLDTRLKAIEAIDISDKAYADQAEADAKIYADGLNTAMNTRVAALEAIDHEHANKELLDTYTQTEADLADAVAKKHAHENADVLAGITADKVAAWDSAEADAIAHANGLNTAMDERMQAVEGKAHEHANSDVLAGISAEKVTAWDAAVQTVTPGVGLTATKTGTDVAIGIDETVTWIFDCGDSGVTA